MARVDERTDDGGTDDDRDEPADDELTRRAPEAWRRPVLAGVAALAVLGIAVAAVAGSWDGSGDDAPEVPGQPAATLAGPAPEAVGTVTGSLGTGCAGMEDCAGGMPGVVDLGSLGAPAELPGEQHIPLDDGRWLERTDTGGTAPWGERNMPEWWLVTPDGERRSLGPVFLESAVALTDGRIAAVWLPMTNEGIVEVRIIEPDATTSRLALPEGVQPSEVVAGPDGAFAVLGTEAGADVCCDLRLLVVGPDGTGGDVVRHDMALPFREAPYGAELGWGPTGLIAVSPPFPEHPEEGDEGNWVTVVDAAAGAVVATVDGWVGTAWSPDGSGLLVGRPSGLEESRLVILHGAALDERTDVGAVPGAFTPRDWRPPAEATERDTASGEGAPTGDGTGTPPTHDGAPTDGGLLTGTLAGTPDCLWLTAGDGARYALVLPPGSTTRTDGDAVVLVDGDGADVARTGDDVEVRGGYVPGETSCPEADATGPAIVAGGVRAG